MTRRPAATVDARIVKALGHPLRVRILQVVDEGVASPRQIADALDEPLGNVSYHVRILRENDALELVDTRPVRGAVEHFYRGTMRPFIDDELWGRLSLATRRQMFGQRLEEIVAHVTDASAEHGFDRVETHVSWTPVNLDEQGWREAARLLVDVMDKLAAIEAESLERLAGEDAAKPVRAEVVLLQFERARRS
jgi:DNA-binding transcriptional ArsR family regulator